jgi:hypothetical protein
MVGNGDQADVQSEMEHNEQNMQRKRKRRERIVEQIRLKVRTEKGR